MRKKVMAGVAVLVVSLGGLVGVAATTASASPGNPVGAFDSVSARFDGNWFITGWAADGDTPGQPVQVRLVFANNKFVQYVATGDARPDVGSAVPGAGPSTGWHATIDLITLYALGKGTPLCAWAVNTGVGSDALLGCRALPTSGSSPFNPRGALDRASSTPGLLRVTGWASDPDGDPTTQLRISIDGVLRVADVAASARPDVAKIGLSLTSGFDITMPLLPGGHGVCVYAQNTGRAGLQNTTVGCVIVATPGVQPAGAHDPVGSLDSASMFSTICGPCLTSFYPVGWAYDPDSAGPIVVRVRAITHSPYVPKTYENGRADNPTGAPRPDVQAAIPQAGPNAGITHQNALGGSYFDAFDWMCAYAQNVGAGASRFLGCTTKS
ncbi:MAG TPA: hypothetical protein VGN59_00930 [Acidimicrobiia bacterium]|jgi:hypothetical protein